MKCVLWCVLLYVVLFILLVRTWNVKKIRGINNIKDLEMMLIYETHPSLIYFPGETDKSHGKIKSWRSISRPSFEAGALPEQFRNIINCANSIHTNQLVKQDLSRRRILMETFSGLGSTQSCQMYCMCDSAPSHRIWTRLSRQSTQLICVHTTCFNSLKSLYFPYRMYCTSLVQYSQ